MLQRPSHPCARIDVFSVRGGVGKTMLAFRLAQRQARETRAPVLLVDADITGPCLGDLLEPWASPPWEEVDNLLDLICGRPEYLLEQLREGHLPVYEMREAEPGDKRALRVAGDARRRPAVLFCPHQLHSAGRHGDRRTDRRVDPAVLLALLGHESAGGWIGHVIDQVILATHELMEGRLGGVIVDHASSMGGLQVASLLECLKSQPDGEEGGRRAVVVTTPRDAPSAQQLVVRAVAAAAPRKAPPGVGPITWLINRVPPGDAGWREEIETRFPQTTGWIEGAFAIHHDPAMVDVALEPSPALAGDIGRVREAIFGRPHAR